MVFWFCISFINIDYGIPILTFDLSLLNWLYITSFNLFFGYESFYSTEVDYSQIIKSKVELNYYLLRTPIQLYSDFSYYYNVDKDKFDYSFTPIMIKGFY